MSTSDEKRINESKFILEDTSGKDEYVKPKYPLVLRPTDGHSTLLLKRLQKKQKFFDSADYQMAKEKAASTEQITATSATVPTKQVIANELANTGDIIPTPETVPKHKMFF